jgi:hypothetical protein
VTRTPYRFTVPAAAVGLVAGWLLGKLLGWEPGFTALGVCLLAQVVVDAWWTTR